MDQNSSIHSFILIFRFSVLGRNVRRSVEAAGVRQAPGAQDKVVEGAEGRGQMRGRTIVNM